MSTSTVVLTNTDAQQLQQILNRSDFNGRDSDYVAALEAEVANAKVVPDSEIPRDVVRMHSRVRIVDMRTGEQIVFRIVFPREANYSEGKISVLAPIATALLGYPVGTEVDWRVPSGYRRLRILAVEHPKEKVSAAA